MTKFRAVWEDSSDTDATSDASESIVDLGPRFNKGKGKALEVDDDDDLDYVPNERDESSTSDEETTPVDIDAEEENTPSKVPPSARALVPTDNGDFVHPHEAPPRSATRETSFADDSDKENRRVTLARRETPVTWPETVGVEPHRVHVMQQSLFHTQPLQPAEPSTQGPPRSASAFLPRTRKHAPEP